MTAVARAENVDRLLHVVDESVKHQAELRREREERLVAERIDEERRLRIEEAERTEREDAERLAVIRREEAGEIASRRREQRALEALAEARTDLLA